jgi:ribosome biogenesis GTPase
MTLCGRIIEEQKNYFVVDTESGSMTATTSGSLKKSKKKACTGDMVDVKKIDTSPLRGVITRIHARSSFIKRPALANCSHLLCLATFREPQLNLEALDRLLFTAHVFDLIPCIVFNKIDLLSRKENSELDRITDTYRSAGYHVKTISCRAGEGIDAIISYCTGKTCICAGLSGVGKSTLLSLIFPDIDFRIGKLSDDANRGIHTTTHISLLSLTGGGYIADTPGLAFIDLPAIPEDEVILNFPEIASCIGSCRFNNCIHDTEPGCMVSEKVAEGSIAKWRHEHYLKIYTEMRERAKQYRS